MTDANMVSAEPGPHAARVAVTVGALGAGVLLLDALGVLGAYADLTLVILGGAGLVAASAGLWRWRPEPRWPWMLQILALLLFLCGGAARVSLGTLGDLSPSRSLLPDALTLPGYLMLGIALLGLARARRRPGANDFDATLDAVIASTACLALAWVYLINPALSERHVDLPIRLLLAAYPAMCVFLVAIGARIAFTADADRPVSLRLLFVTLLATLAGETFYMLVDAHIAEVDPRFLDLPFGLAYVALMTAFLHPSLRQVSTPVHVTAAAPRRGPLRVRRRRLVHPSGDHAEPGPAEPGRSAHPGGHRDRLHRHCGLADVPGPAPALPGRTATGSSGHPRSAHRSGQPDLRPSPPRPPAGPGNGRHDRPGVPGPGPVSVDQRQPGPRHR